MYLIIVYLNIFNSITNVSVFQAEDDAAKSEEEKLEEELARLMDESCIQEFLEQRMQVQYFFSKSLKGCFSNFTFYYLRKCCLRKPIDLNLVQFSQ